jgi:hypothetical protein
MFATGESQLGPKPYPEILFARNGKAGVTELVRVMRNEAMRNEGDSERARSMTVD